MSLRRARGPARGAAVADGQVQPNLDDRSRFGEGKSARRWLFVFARAIGAIGIVGATLLARQKGPPEVSVGMVYEHVTVEPQPVIEDTMVGDCPHSTIDVGGLIWHEYFRSRAEPVAGRLVVTDVKVGYASATFEADETKAVSYTHLTLPTNREV